MKIEWEEERRKSGHGYYRAEVGPLLLSLQETSRAHWIVTVSDYDGGETWAADETFIGTLDEAKARAIALGLYTLSPWVDLGCAERTVQEREACAKVADAWARHERATNNRLGAEVAEDIARDIRARTDGAP